MGLEFLMVNIDDIQNNKNPTPLTSCPLKISVTKKVFLSVSYTSWTKKNCKFLIQIQARFQHDNRQKKGAK